MKITRIICDEPDCGKDAHHRFCDKDLCYQHHTAIQVLIQAFFDGKEIFILSPNFEFDDLVLSSATQFKTAFLRVKDIGK